MQQLLLEFAPPPPPTLENFSPGKNGAALKALREALEDGERFVFLWGPSGSGKTHLLRAFAEAAAAVGRAAYVQAANADWAGTGDLASTCATGCALRAEHSPRAAGRRPRGSPCGRICARASHRESCCSCTP